MLELLQVNENAVFLFAGEKFKSWKACWAVPCKRDTSASEIRVIYQPACKASRAMT
ncbi:hypothetical protein [Thiothrix litoralis]|uniref:hypothetical protein n=1 Tax=Thiothrix litoralis TaxID=2891210 RepID=UPI001D19205A|nr:hypothetical protein [Thiothrix litoralis]